MAEDEESSPSSEPSSPVKKESLLQRMLNSIVEERNRTHPTIGDDDSGFELVNVSNFWTKLFSQYFLDGSTSPDESRDDMLFYVRRNKLGAKGKPASLQAEIEVYRRDSKKLPSLDDKTVDWEETVYLNIILHQFVYRVTCAVCTRTDEKNLQILRKFTQRVYPSPSRRRMDSKGTEEEITYPNIFFTVDNFEEAFQDIIIRDSENIAVELLATDKDGSFQGLIFQGSVKYESLKRVYDARISLTSKMVQRMSLGWFKGHKRVEYMRMRGPQGKGHAEMAVSRVKGSGPETPDMENFPVDDFDDQQNQYAQRRMSDPSSGFSSLMRGGFRRAVGMKKSQSETENVETVADDGCHEVEAGTLQEELNTNLDQYNGFWGKSFGQAWHWFKEQKRASSVALNAYLTYITLPWHRIIADMIDARHQPALTH
ncbi:uncharacterized protein KIAA0930 homolog [Haliotis rubra]|uniref:uncharacterized protein KIAA0930 homolog n=1 Tax=Haliotis rubra TaxID=36100 RepID=UPI001EE587CE|nr:uncharacterized protein KIAA0930 homolog [Haliotis rubra]